MTVTTAGMTEAIYLFGNISSPDEFTYIAYGTGTTAADVSDTTLETETDREAATVTVFSTLTENDTIRFSYEFTASSSVTISEVGIFNDSTAGDMLIHEVLAEADRVAVTTGQKVLVECDCTLKDGGTT